MEIKLSEIEADILEALSRNEELCYNYAWLAGELGVDRKYLEPAIKNLKTLGLIEFWRGLMNEDGEVAGSGWCRSRAGNEYLAERAQQNYADHTEPYDHDR